MKGFKLNGRNWDFSGTPAQQHIQSIQRLLDRLPVMELLSTDEMLKRLDFSKEVLGQIRLDPGVLDYRQLRMSNGVRSLYWGHPKTIRLLRKEMGKNGERVS